MLAALPTILANATSLWSGLILTRPTLSATHSTATISSHMRGWIWPSSPIQEHVSVQHQGISVLNAATVHYVSGCRMIVVQSAALYMKEASMCLYVHSMQPHCRCSMGNNQFSTLNAYSHFDALLLSQSLHCVQSACLSVCACCS